MNPESTVSQSTESLDAVSLTQLSVWTRTILTTAASVQPAASPGSHPNALTTAPRSPADNAAIAQCLANPDRVGRQVLGTAYGVFLGEPAVLVIYASANGPQSVDSVAYQVPCSSNNYHILEEAVVTK